MRASSSGLKHLLRTVTAPRDVVMRADVGSRREVALTFDDGPNPHNTLPILELLNAYDARATFFLIGRKIDDNRSAIVRQIAASGHEIGNHTYSHARTTSTPDRLDEELRATDDAIARSAGVTVRVCRPPFGNNVRRFAAAARRRSQRTVLWSTDTEDWRDDGAVNIAKRAAAARPGEIILLHDSGPLRPHLIEATRRILDSLATDGFRFVTLSNLLGADEH